MKTSLVPKIILSNVLLLAFILGTFFIIDKYIQEDLASILQERKNIAIFKSKIDEVSTNLYQSSNLHDDSYLSKASTSSLDAIKALELLESRRFDTKEIKNHYIEFFKYSVITTSMLLEGLLDKARAANISSSKKHKILYLKMNEIISSLDLKQSNITNKIIYLTIISSIIAILVSFVNTMYIIRSYKSVENKQQELQNIQLKAVLKENEANNQRAVMLNAIGDGVYGVDKNGICTFINKSAADLLEFNVDEIIKINQHLLFHHHKIDKSHYPAAECPIYHTLNDRETRVCEEYFITKSGKFIPISLTVAPTGDEGAIVVFKDITEVKKHEEELQGKVNEKTKELQKLNENLEEKVKEEVAKNRQKELQLFEQSKLASMGEMIGNIAHQWRQPLSIITTSSSGMKLKKELDMLDDEFLDVSLDVIEDNAHFLSETIDTFRDFIKEEKVLKEVILQERIDIALDIINATLKNNHIELKNNIDYSNPIKITLVVGELTQVIINIINNAKDVLLKEKIEDAWIKLDLEKHDGKVIITIEDNGGGIPDEIVPKIFDPYFTTKHQSQGTGLGLHMSYKIIVDSLKGKLYSENTNNGAKFIIELPL